MKSNTERRKIDPAKEVIAGMLRLARVGINPGETIPRAVQKIIYSDIGSGSFESRLHGKERKE